MYTPKAFKISEQEALDFIQQNAFGQLISTIDGRITVSHLPFLLDKTQGVLLCHLAKANPQWQAIEKQQVLVTFQGAHDYISPSWYQKAGVPTWNYQAVHVYGEAELINEPKALKDIVNRLSVIYEKQFEDPWTPSYPETMLNAILGLKITIKELQGTFKLSQNKSKFEQEQIYNALVKQGSIALAAEMQNKPLD